MKNWNENEWQGRRKDQLETSAKLVALCFVICIVLSVGLLVVSLI